MKSGLDDHITDPFGPVGAVKIGPFVDFELETARADIAHPHVRRLRSVSGQRTHNDHRIVKGLTKLHRVPLTRAALARPDDTGLADKVGPDAAAAGPMTARPVGQAIGTVLAMDAGPETGLAV